jgi:hypothetical protein
MTQGESQAVFFPEMPVRIYVDVLPRVWTMESRNDGVWFTGGERAAFNSDEGADAVELRAALLAANTPEQALEFLNRYHCTWENAVPPDDDDYSYSDFCATQRLIQRIVSLPLEEDMFAVDGNSSHYYLDGQLTYAPAFGIENVWTNYPRISLRYENSNRLISALGMLSWIERRREIRYRFCKREDCRRMFRRKTRQEKDYCTPSCAHLAHVRKSRERQRQERKQKPVKE